MRTPGVFRNVDSLGRVVIPAQYRQRLNISPGDVLELSVEQDSIILRKREEVCTFCGGNRELVLYMAKPVCRACIACLKG